MNCTQAKSDDDGNETGDDLHVLLVRDGEDDDEEEGRAQHLVHCQAHCRHLRSKLISDTFKVRRPFLWRRKGRIQKCQ